jgi:hypothetical protein
MSYTLVTQSFGKENEYRRVILTVWSFFAHIKDPLGINTILFTDNPSFFIPYFKNLPVEYILLTKDKIQAMRGSIDFIHRMKIALIEEAFKKTDTDILYTDSDTFFTMDPSRMMANLSLKTSYMHTREYAFEYLKDIPLPSGEPFLKFYRLIKESTFKTTTGTLEVSLQQYSWNAGVMMFHRDHEKLLPDVYALTDQLYPSTRNHASEQYAFSIIMQKNTTIQPCEEAIYHYWYRVKKAIADLFLQERINEQWASGSIEFKYKSIRHWTEQLPNIFENHILTLRDNAVQAFNSNNFTVGYKYALKALLMEPFNLTFIKDILYHFKRSLHIK